MALSRRKCRSSQYPGFQLGLCLLLHLFPVFSQLHLHWCPAPSFPPQDLVLFIDHLHLLHCTPQEQIFTPSISFCVFVFQTRSKQCLMESLGQEVSEGYRWTLWDPACLQSVCQRHRLATGADDPLTPRAELLTNLQGRSECNHAHFMVKKKKSILFIL